MKKVIYRFTYDDMTDFSIVYMNGKRIGKIMKRVDVWYYQAIQTTLYGTLHKSREQVKESIEVLFDKE